MEHFAHNHDHQIWECLARILDVDLNQCEAGMKASASLPLSMGGLGLRSAVRTRVPAHWSSWADCLPMVHARHPDVAMQMVALLEGDPETPSLGAAVQAARRLVGVRGFEPPSWRDHPHVTWRILNQGVGDLVGSTRRLAARTTIQGHVVCCQVEPQRPSHDPVPGRTRSRHGSDDLPHVPHHDHSSAVVPRHSFAPSSSPSSPDRAFLPVWPPTR